MSVDNFKYDVAFSFVQEDEGLAFELYKLLKDGLSCFIYSENQKRLAGADGEKVFNSVFSKETRIVVVLYRNEWATTKWTKIEETAIRNKGFEYGYDFVILIPTNNIFTPPEWLPKNRIWVGLERWGIESAASAIETRVQEFGGKIKIESVSDKVARKEQEIIDRQKREQTLNSSQGLALAFNEVKEVVSEIKRHEKEINVKASNWHIKVRDNKHNGCDIMSYGYYLTFQFYQKWSNNMDGAYLYVALFKGYFDENGNSNGSDNQLINKTRIRFDINEFNQYGWTSNETRDNFITTIKLVEDWFNNLINYASEEKIKQNY